MGELNLTPQEQEALQAIDIEAADQRIDTAINDRRAGGLRGLRLHSCGPYVASHARAFESALSDLSAVKSNKKIASTELDARRAGFDLANAIGRATQRLETETAERQLFFVEDNTLMPHRFSERLTTRVSYRWRRSIEDPWQFGSIEFAHDADGDSLTPAPVSQRRPSAAKRKHDRQERLCSEWEHLRRLSLFAIRDYLREGRDGAQIPATFHVRPDPRTRRLNNFSAEFWTAHAPTL